MIWKRKKISKEPEREVPDFDSVLDNVTQDNTDDMFGKMMEIADNDKYSENDVIEGMIRSMTKLLFPAEIWTETHPTEIKCASDKFYATLAAEIYSDFFKLNFEHSMPRETFRVAAMSIAAYLEDLVSGTGVWQTVRNIYKRQYGKQLPFFDADHDDYFEDDINIEDIKLLIWQAMNRCGAVEERVFSPYSQAVSVMAEKAFDRLVDAYEKAPEATRVRDHIRRVFRDCNYFEVRELAYWLNSSNPLTCVPFAREHLEAEADDAVEDLSEINTLSYSAAEYYIKTVGMSWKRYMSLNGCHTTQFLSELASIHNGTKAVEALKSFERLPQMVYLVEDTKGKYLTVKDKAGRVRKVLKSSMNDTDFSVIKSGVMELVRFGDEWYQNGLASLSTSMPDKEVEMMIENVPENIRETMDKIIAANDGRKIFYCKNMRQVSDILVKGGLAPMPEEAFGGQNFTADNYLLLLSNIMGPMVMPGDCDIFEDKNNPFKGNARKKEFGFAQASFIVNSSLPDDIIDYIVKGNYLSHAWIYASQGREFGRELVQNNMAFMFRFYRVEAYYPPENDDEEDIDNDEEE